jgi:hypothetical protein
LKRFAWQLLNSGHLLLILEIDEAERRVKSVMSLKRSKPMTEAEALKYFNDNYPKDGSAVRAAAEALGLGKK